MLEFPYFFVGTFIEAPLAQSRRGTARGFPYFFVGTFIEAPLIPLQSLLESGFPSYSEGLSLRLDWPRLYAWWLHKFPFLF